MGYDNDTALPIINEMYAALTQIMLAHELTPMQAQHAMFTILCHIIQHTKNITPFETLQVLRDFCELAIKEKSK